MLKHLFKLSLLVILILPLGCTKSGGGDSSDSSDSDEREGLVPEGLFSQCGALLDGKLVNPIPIDQAVRVNVEPISTDVLAVSLLEDAEGIGDAGGKILVKLQGVTSDGVSGAGISNGLEIIRQNGRAAFFVPAGSECTVVVDGGGVASAGQIFGNGVETSGNGTSLNEILLEKGALKPDPSDPCSGPALLQCYSNIREIRPVSPNSISSFLWKPVSERDKNLVILVDACDVTIHVEGVITSTGNTGYPANGRCTQQRFPAPGCAYGNNVKVSFSDSSGALVPIFGEDFITVPSGCSRFER